jgi:hypothetical protein
MKDGKNMGIAIINNFVSKKSTTYAITVDVYDAYGKKSIEGVMLINSFHGLEHVPITYRDT